MTKDKILVFLDKAWPPEHSFVDGMLAGSVPEYTRNRCIIFVSRVNGSGTYPRRYRGAIAVPVLYPRRGLGRFLNFFVVGAILSKLKPRFEKNGLPLRMFSRNDPVTLYAASVFKRPHDVLCFQSSHPHEQVTGSALKRIAARFFFNLASKNVDSLTAVSPLGLVRTRKLFPCARVAQVIPLMSDAPDFVQHVAPIRKADDEPMKFVYAGTHYKSRRLDVVLKAISRLDYPQGKLKFVFVGGTRSEIEALKKEHGVFDLVQTGVVEFMPRIARNQIWEVLLSCHIGLSLAPPDPAYREMSPTKLAEYMSTGLATLATRGIESQDQLIRDSKGGELVDFNAEDISSGISQLVEDWGLVEKMRCDAKTFATKNLSYRRYNSAFLECMGL